jgi:hypothetical protein
MAATDPPEYLRPVPGSTVDYRADRGSEDPRTDNEDVIRKWAEWKKQSAKRKLKYFIPDWDDVVDPRYDFENERYGNSTGPEDRGSGGWDNEVFAHQFYDTPSYDGLLVSRDVLRKSKKKARVLEALANGNGGVHRYLRVPPDFPVMGDCGAYGYVDEPHPPYTVDDVLDYYTRHGFNYGISVDHLVFGASDEEGRKRRYDLTLRNAEEFYRKHRQQGLPWRPMAAVQGWDIDSYVAAAKQSVAMGYDYLAIGGLVRSSTDEVVLILRKIREAIGPEVHLHALGVARFATIKDFLEVGVTSMDSATYLRRAWTSARDNLWTRDRHIYTAIRIPAPVASLRARAKSEGNEGVERKIAEFEVKEGRRLTVEERETVVNAAQEAAKVEIMEEHLDTARALEQQCFDALRLYAEHDDAYTLTSLIELISEYEACVGRSSRREDYVATLAARPWDACDCAICAQAGVEVTIFRGNNRNRRRGFHNTRVFYDLLGEALETGELEKSQRGADVLDELLEAQGLEATAFSPEGKQSSLF